MKRMLQNSQKGKISTAQYPEELKKFAMTLQFYSRKAYNYVRKTFDLALPSPSIIPKWLTNVSCEPGFTEQAFNALKLQVVKDKEDGMATICLLMLDETSIKKQIDFAANKIWGYTDCGLKVEEDELSCAREALVLMVVAVNRHWKLPVAYFLIHSMTASEKANIVKETLIKLEEAGVKIPSVTCDGPTAHLSMARQLGATIDDAQNICSHFKHPVSENNVYMVFDVCHMLKLLRNAWATLEVFINDKGERIEFGYIKKLHDLQEDEMLRFGNKLKKAHIQWAKQKMKVNLAAQIFSNSVADALEFLMTDIGHPDFQGAGPTIAFLRLIDRLFDLLNSKNPFGKGCKAPLKLSNIAYWKPIFEQGLHFFRTCKDCRGQLMVKGPRKTAFLGFIVSIKSMMGIFDEYVASRQLLLKYRVSK